MTFIDKDTGAEYEAVKRIDFMKQAEITANPDNYIVIRPIPNKPKCEIRTPADVRIDGSEGIDVYWADKDQAQLIKEAVEALMEYISSTSDYDLSDQQSRVIKFSHKARQSLRSDNE